MYILVEKMYILVREIVNFMRRKIYPKMLSVEKNLQMGSMFVHCFDHVESQIILCWQSI